MSRAQVEALSALIAQSRAQPRLGIVEERARWEALAATFAPDDVTFETSNIAGVPVERATARPPVDAATTLLYLHGGGYVSGSPRTHRRLTAEVARRTDWSVLSVDYRLAPEHPCPAAIADVLAVLDALPAGRLVLAGDSAGGRLALASAVALREAGRALPAALWLISPWADLARSLSPEGRAATDAVIDHAQLAESALAYAGALDPADPRASPVYAGLTGLPPLLVQVGGAESLLADAVAVAGRAGAAGVDVTLRIWPGMIHSFSAMVGVIDEAAAAIAEALAWATDRLG